MPTKKPKTKNKTTTKGKQKKSKSKTTSSALKSTEKNTKSNPKNDNKVKDSKINQKVWYGVVMVLLVLLMAKLATYTVNSSQQIEKKKDIIINNEARPATPSRSSPKANVEPEENKSNDMSLKPSVLVSYTSIPDGLSFEYPSKMYLLDEGDTKEFTFEKYEVDESQVQNFESAIGYTTTPEYGIVFAELYEAENGDITDLATNQPEIRVIKVGNTEVDGSPAVEYAVEGISINELDGSERNVYSHRVLAKRPDGSFIELYSWAFDISDLQVNKETFVDLLKSTKLLPKE